MLFYGNEEVELPSTFLVLMRNIFYETDKMYRPEVGTAHHAHTHYLAEEKIYLDHAIEIILPSVNIP